MRKIPFAGIELTSQRVRGLRGTHELPGRPALCTNDIIIVPIIFIVRKNLSSCDDTEIQTQVPRQKVSRLPTEPPRRPSKRTLAHHVSTRLPPGASCATEGRGLQRGMIPSWRKKQDTNIK